MNRSVLRQNLASVLLLALMCVGGAAVRARLPESLPTHFDWKGQADGYSPRDVVLVAFPLLAAALLALVPFLVRVSPSGYRMEDSRAALAKANVSVAVLIFGIWLGLVLPALEPGAWRFEGIFGLTLGVFMLIFGNYLSKLQRNFFVGIRTPWTLTSDANWRRTHRFGARLMVGLGVVAVAAAALGAPLMVGVGLLIASLTPPVLYSYLTRAAS